MWTFGPTVQDVIERRIEEVIRHTTAAAGASYAFEFKRGVPVTANDR